MSDSLEYSRGNNKGCDGEFFWLVSQFQIIDSVFSLVSQWSA